MCGLYIDFSKYLLKCTSIPLRNNEIKLAIYICLLPAAICSLVVLVLNYAPYHEDIWGSVGIILCISTLALRGVEGSAS
jgi:hypothetical protein